MKYQILILIVTVFCLFNGAVVYGQEDSPAVVISVSGEVQTKPSETAPWSSVEAKQGLREGSVLRSGLGSSAIIEFKPGHRARLDENTIIELAKLQYPTGQSEEQTTINLTVGKILNNVKKLKTEDSEYSVQTPTASAAVRGTVYEVAYDEESKKTTVRVLEGLIDMQSRIGRRLSTTLNEREKSGIDASGMVAPTEPLSDSEAGEMEQAAGETGSAQSQTGDASTETGQLDAVQSEMNDRMDALQNRISDDNRANRLNELRGNDDDF